MVSRLAQAIHTHNLYQFVVVQVLKTADNMVLICSHGVRAVT